MLNSKTRSRHIIPSYYITINWLFPFVYRSDMYNDRGNERGREHANRIKEFEQKREEKRN